MNRKLRELVRTRADDCCEYCRIPQAATPLITFHIEHIIARQHEILDEDDPEKLALACDRCNACKGTNLTFIDEQTGEIVRLFHPREDVWEEHFHHQEGLILGLTSVGRATVRLLMMNAPHRVELRKEWLKEGEELS